MVGFQVVQFPGKKCGTQILLNDVRNQIMRLLYIKDHAVQRSVYRTFQLEHALDLISRCRLVLVAPRRWDDPYENLLHKHFRNQYDVDTGPVSRWYGGNLFGSCWTWTPESDFAWRVYVPEGKIGVIVESTVEKLLIAINSWGGLFAMRDCFVGEVQYLSGEEILAAITSENFQLSNSSSDTAHMRAIGLLLKRPEFQHEHEVRAIVECSERERIRDSVFVDVPIDPNEFIGELVIDPRIDGDNLETSVIRLRAAGYEGNIRQSKLYRLPWERDLSAG
jgi:hypothetical protein